MTPAQIRQVKAELGDEIQAAIRPFIQRPITTATIRQMKASLDGILADRIRDTPVLQFVEWTVGPDAANPWKVNANLVPRYGLTREQSIQAIDFIDNREFQ